MQSRLLTQIGGLFCMVALLGLSACNSSESNSAGAVLGQDQTQGNKTEIPSPSQDETNPSPLPTVTSTPSPLPSTTPTPEPTPTPSTVGSSCSGSSTNQYCLGLKYVVYADSSGTPVVTQDQAISNLKSINEVWSQCGIAFQMDSFLAADPEEYRLTFNTANTSELDDIRAAFEESSTLLVVTTGKWNRSGTLGNTGANAWTNMPGQTYLGSILEAPVGTYPNIIAHEIGHYLNLGHVSDQSDLMNPIIYDTSKKLTTSQCSEAKSAINYFWKKMIR